MAASCRAHWPDEAQEGRRRVVILFKDITVRKRAEDALKT
jgi:hypothetical protein